MLRGKLKGRKIKVLIPAGGKGVRSGLSYPKTLKKFCGKPLLIRILEAVRDIDSTPSVIISPQGADMTRDAIESSGCQAELLVQLEPKGMGDAIRTFRSSLNYSMAKDLLVVWGDTIVVRSDMLKQLIKLYSKNRNILAFPSILSDSCYTYVERDLFGKVTSLMERREYGDALPTAGERDIGIFLFRKDIIFNILENNENELLGLSTGEIGFLPVISIAAKSGYSVEAYMIAEEIDTLSFNSPADLVRAESYVRNREAIKEALMF